MSVPAGWYQDPSQTDQLRYWDGQEWTQHTHAAAPSEPSPGAATQSFAPASATPPADESFATPASLQANPVSSVPPSAPMPYGGGNAQYSPTPTFAASTPKRRLGTGAIVGIVVSAVALVGIIGVLVVVGLGRLADDSFAASTTTSPTDTTTDDTATTDDATGLDDLLGTDGPGETAQIPADFSVPDGWQLVRRDDLGVAYGVPSDWADITDAYSDIFGSEPQEVSGEVVTFLSAWNPGSAEGLGSTDVVILHSQLPFSYGTELYSAGAQRGFASTAGDTSWTGAVTYTNNVGESVTVSTGTPTGPATYAFTDMYVVGGGDAVVLVQCVAYDQTRQLRRRRVCGRDHVGRLTYRPDSAVAQRNRYSHSVPCTA